MSGMLPEKGYKRIMVICFYAVLAIAGLYLFFNYLFKWLWPVFVAAAVGVILQPVIRFIRKKLKMPNKLVAVLLTVILYGVVGYAVFALIYKIVSELAVLASAIPSYIQKLNIDLGNLEADIKGFISGLPFEIKDEWFDPIWGSLTNSIINMISGISSSLLSGIPGLAVKIVQFFPSMLIAVIIMIISSVYFASDHDKIWGFVKHQFSPKTIERFTSLKEHLFQTIVKYLRAYILIMFITGVEVYLGLSIMGQKYALLIAIGIAIIDVLPVLGTGTVLIPWGVILILTGNVGRGIAILALYLIVTVIRQILEPKIIGEYIGLYPLITLISMYAGLQAFGIVGMFLFPITVIILKNLNENGSVHLWKAPPGMEMEKKEPRSARIVKKLTQSASGKKYKAEVKDRRPGEDEEK